jgi:hypothetical protein
MGCFRETAWSYGLREIYLVGLMESKLPVINTYPVLCSSETRQVYDAGLGDT